MKVLWRLLPVIATRRGRFIETVVWSAVAQLGALALALLLASAMGRMLARERPDLALLLAIAVPVACVVGLAAWRESWVSHDLAYGLIATLRGRVFRALGRALPSRRDARRSGDLVTAAVADIETLEWLYAHSAAQAISAVVVLLVSGALSVMLSPMLLLLWIPLLVCAVIAPQLTDRRTRRDGDALAAGRAQLRSDVLDTVRGVRELDGAGALDRQLDRIADETARLGRVQVREASRLGAERAVSEVALALAALGAILVVVLLGSGIAARDVPLAVTVAVSGLGPAAQLAELWRNAAVLRSAAQRVSDVLGAEPAVVSADAPSPMRTDERGLVFEGVQFGYDAAEPVLDGVSAHISSGEVVALVGPSGAGKTTLARLALRLWDPDAGSVRIDGVDVRDLPDEQLRALVSAVPQSSPVLRGTVRSNIVLGYEDATETGITAAAEAAGVLDPAAGFPDGLDSAIGEHGAGLSGGQRARVALARALVRNPRVLVLDEPTASLDADADAAVMEFLTRPSDRAVLLITHRPSTIALAHRTLELGSISAAV